MPSAASISAPLADPAIRRLWDGCLATARTECDPVAITDDGIAFQSAAHLPYMDLAYLDAIDRSSRGSIVLNVYGDPPRSMSAEYTFKRGPLGVTAPPPLTPFTPILLARPAILERVRTDQAKHASDVRITLPPGTALPKWIAPTDGDSLPHAKTERVGQPVAESVGFTAAESLSRANREWQSTQLVTYMLTLTRHSDMIASWSQNRRRTLDKHAHTFHVSEEGDAQNIVAHLVANSYTRHARRPPLPVESLARLATLCHEAGLCRIFVARELDGTPAAAIAVLLGNRVASYWMAGSVPGPSMTVLLARVLKTLSHDGIVAFDFVGANTPSIAEFKRRFGGTLLPYHSIHWSSRPARALQFARSLIRRGGA